MIFSEYFDVIYVNDCVRLFLIKECFLHNCALDEGISIKISVLIGNWMLYFVVSLLFYEILLVKRYSILIERKYQIFNYFDSFLHNFTWNEDISIKMSVLIRNVMLYFVVALFLFFYNILLFKRYFVLIERKYRIFDNIPFQTFLREFPLHPKFIYKIEWLTMIYISIY